ncbi:unnamed protein product [Fusarium venenatum]|uniref:Uncharacterized protein n=1 Tax=Fusarium venenatum TaxID=56646 RepID=A0A2L2THI1_9HYPO|nr:uncharacterized protein FVRRES_10509 [Fusarium venenatum]CEI70432.1 unnamed protein product [Fusarium venenatum]
MNPVLKYGSLPPLVVDYLVVNGNIGTPGQDSGDIYGFENGIRARALDQGGYTGINNDTDRSTSIWQHISSPHARPVFQLFYKVLQMEDDNDCKVNVYYGNQLFLRSDSFQDVADWRAVSGMPSLTTLSFDLRILVDLMFISAAISLSDLDRVKIDWKAATLVQPTMRNTSFGETSQANPSTTDTKSTSETAVSSQADASNSLTSTTPDTTILPTHTRSNTETFLSSTSQLSSVAESELATSLDTLPTSSETLTTTSPLMSESSIVSESSLTPESATSANIESETSVASDSTSIHILEPTTFESTTSTALESTITAGESTTTNALSTSDISSSGMSTETSSITSWTLTVSATAMPASTMPTTTNGSGPFPTSIDDLSPAAREIFDFIMDKLTPNDRNLHVPAAQMREMASHSLYPSTTGTESVKTNVFIMTSGLVLRIVPLAEIWLHLLGRQLTVRVNWITIPRDVSETSSSIPFHSM